VVGIFAAAVSNFTVAYRDKLPWDDGLDIFAGHATSGTSGM
jgi:ammonia channel protein AmtB